MRITILLVFLGFFAQAQYDHGCDGKRYTNEVLEDVKVTTEIYGRNVNVLGDSIDLRMDIYDPQNDDAYGRPVIILAHGGSFIAGTRKDMGELCQRFAVSGYVAATIDYRLLNLLQGLPDSTKSMDIAVKASHDMKAAIRYFKHSAIDGGNPYNIDPEMMFIGGYSAGAVTALIAGTVDSVDIAGSFIVDVMDENGGLQGSTGNPAYKEYGEEVKGIVNYSGAIYDTSWIDAEDPFIASFHGTEDATVAYGHDYVVVLNQNIVKLHGSGSIHDHLESMGHPNYLYTVESGGHVDIYVSEVYQDDRIEAVMKTDSLMAEIICGSITNVEVMELKEVLVYPNPATTNLFLEGVTAGSMIEIYNELGELVKREEYRDSGVEVMGMQVGMYIVIAEQGDSRYVGRFIKG